MLKTMLIDDEKIALDVLEILLNEIGGVTVVGKCQIVSEALVQAEALQPDIIFLDIEMPGLNGLAAGKQLAVSCPDAEIVFVTAYNQYAIDAFETNAIDYLLKPVAKERLINSLERYDRLYRKRLGVRQANPEENADPATGKKLFQLNAMGSLELYSACRKLITWRTKKTKELFAYLWSFNGNPVYRYRILDDLWPEIDSGKAQTLFHTTLYYLRNMLKLEGLPCVVTFGDERYWMHTEAISSDVERLEALMQSSSSDPSELLALYRGDYLEMEHYQWADSRRQELRRTYIRHLEWMHAAADANVQALLQQKLSELDYSSE